MNDEGVVTRWKCQVHREWASVGTHESGENARRGTRMRKAARQDRSTDHAPTGHDLADGVVITKDEADTVRAILRLRAEGLSRTEISRRFRVSLSAVLSILRNGLPPRSLRATTNLLSEHLRRAAGRHAP